jgi:hypothetical protein
MVIHRPLPHYSAAATLNANCGLNLAERRGQTKTGVEHSLSTPVLFIERPS